MSSSLTVLKFGMLKVIMDGSTYTSRIGEGRCSIKALSFAFPSGSCDI